MAYIETIRNKANNKTKFRVQIRLQGYTPESKSFSKMAAAKEWAARREIEIKEGRQAVEEKAKAYTVGDVIDRYIKDVLPLKTTKVRSRNIQKGQLEWWKSEIGVTTLNNVTRAILTEKRDQLGSRLKPGTVNRYMAALSHVFTICYKEWEYIRSNPLNKISMMKEPRLRVRYLTDDERVKMLSESKKLDPMLYLYIILALSTGARKSELLTLKWEDIDLEKNRAVLHETKNNERRAVFYYATAAAALQQKYKDRRKGFKYVFAKRRNDIPVNIYPNWYKLLEKLKLKDFRLHDLRHCFATELARLGYSLKDIAELLGHKTLTMVQRYAHMVDSHASKVVKEMNESLIV